MPCCANKFLLTDVLRQRWGFDGFVVSDGGAIWDIWAQHKYVPTPEAAAAAAVRAGCDFCSGNSRPKRAVLRRAANWTADTGGWVTGGDDYNYLPRALMEGLITEKEIDAAARRELTSRFRLGMFDPPSLVPWSKIGADQIDTPEHQALALKVAEESIVLLKNDGVLPLDRAKIKHIAVIGPNADAVEMLLGNYHGKPSHPVTILAGIKQVAGKNIEVTYEAGCPVAVKRDGSNKPAPEALAHAVAAAKAADVVIYVGGINSSFESERTTKPRRSMRDSTAATARALNCRRRRRI